MTRKVKTKKENPLKLVQNVFNGGALYRYQVVALISFALDNLMDFDDPPEVWEEIFKDVVKRKLKHYGSSIQA